MGSNQSLSPEKHGESFEPLDADDLLDTDNLVSRLHSPVATTPHSVAKSRFSFQTLPRSLSTSLHSSTEPASSRQLGLFSRLTSSSTTSLATDSPDPAGDSGRQKVTSRQGRRQQLAKSVSGGGIVVVNPGRLRAASSLSDVSSLSHCHEGTTGRTADDLQRRFRRLPMFEPLIPTWNANISSLQDASTKNNATDKCVPRFEHNFDAQELTAISSCYANHLRQTVAKVGQQQCEILGLQNKLDYDIRRLTTTLAVRTKGVPAAAGSHRDRLPTSVNDISRAPAGSGLAGARQVDSVVLQTSQLSSLLSQCSLMAKEVEQTLDELNDRLPEDQRLCWPSNTEL